jgi:tetratricopeptide (TPR) repeat protein
VLEGSVRRDSNRLRFTSQLIDATSAGHIWADRFDGELSDIFDLQDRITGNVVAAIEPKMQLAEIERLRHKTPADLNAYDHLLRAQKLEYEFTEKGFDAALRHLDHPAYAPAMAFAAYCYGWRRTQGWVKDVAAETAEGLRLMSRALEVSKFDANVLWMSAVATWQLGLEDKSALELAHRSLDANPNSAIALTIAGRVEALSGNYAGGKELLTRAMRLNPRDPRAWFTFQGMAIACLGEGQFADSASWGRKALAQNPRFAGAIRTLAANLAYLGQNVAAAEAIANLLASSRI